MPVTLFPFSAFIPDGSAYGRELDRFENVLPIHGGARSLREKQAVASVRRREELSRGLAPQRVSLAVGGGDPVGRVGLPAFELLYPGNLQAEVFLEDSLVDPVPLLDGLGADELIEHAGKSLP